MKKGTFKSNGDRYRKQNATGTLSTFKIVIIKMFDHTYKYTEQYNELSYILSSREPAIWVKQGMDNAGGGMTERG